MNNPKEIRDLADQRLQEAEVLYNNGMYDGAFYLAGYSVELALKAKICDRLGIPNLYDDSDNSVNGIRGISKLRGTLKTHDLFMLLIFSGFKVRFDNEKSTNKSLAIANSLLFSAWDENVRYKPCGFKREEDVKNLITLIKDILQWIDQQN